MHGLAGTLPTTVPCSRVGRVQVGMARSCVTRENQLPMYTTNNYSVQGQRNACEGTVWPRQQEYQAQNDGSNFQQSTELISGWRIKAKLFFRVVAHHARKTLSLWKTNFRPRWPFWLRCCGRNSRDVDLRMTRRVVREGQNLVTICKPQLHLAIWVSENSAALIHSKF